VKVKSKRELVIGICLLAAFALWTILVSAADVKSIGPDGSKVGLAALNGYVHEKIGVHLYLYDLTDVMSVIPLAEAACFGLLGLAQWIKRKSLTGVDRRLFLLGAYFAAVFVVFLVFELFPINYRPVLTEGILEASYPSSTTLLVLSVMPVSCVELSSYIKMRALRIAVKVFTTVFCTFMVTARLFSGVHWLTDIIGGIIISASLVMLYVALRDKA